MTKHLDPKFAKTISLMNSTEHAEVEPDMTFRSLDFPAQEPMFELSI